MEATMKKVFKVEWTDSLNGPCSEWFTEKDSAVALLHTLEGDHFLPSDLPHKPTITEYRIPTDKDEWLKLIEVLDE
jgi:hypothetical protein